MLAVGGKTTQIIKRAIDPLQRAQVVEMCQNNKFSLMIDESNDHICNKGLVLLVRAAETSRVHTRFLDMPVVNVGGGENILKRFQSCFIHILANRAHAKFEVKNKSFRALSRIFFRNLICL